MHFLILCAGADEDHCPRQCITISHEMRVVLHFSIEISKIVGKKIIDFILCTFRLGACFEHRCISKNVRLRFHCNFSNAFLHNNGILIQRQQYPIAACALKVSYSNVLFACSRRLCA